MYIFIIIFCVAFYYALSLIFYATYKDRCFNKEAEKEDFIIAPIVLPFIIAGTLGALCAKIMKK